MQFFLEEIYMFAEEIYMFCGGNIYVCGGNLNAENYDLFHNVYIKTSLDLYYYILIFMIK
jgi:hypothetical protein